MLHAAALTLALCGAAQAAAGKTVHVHLLDGDDARGDGSYAKPYKSWRKALQHAGSGDTVVAKNGDYRKAGQAARWGGTAGLAYDPCHQQACDDADNVGAEALDVNSDAMAFVLLQYAMSTADLNGVPGAAGFPPPSPLPAP